MLAHAAPSLATVDANDNAQLAADHRLTHVRAQLAVVRSLTDHAEQSIRADNAEALRDQLIEEMTRLGCRFFEAAASMTRSTSVDTCRAP